ncbi:MAG: lysophospholipid acyltransferase family protein [Oscillospiraceae bacterium]
MLRTIGWFFGFCTSLISLWPRQRRAAQLLAAGDVAQADEIVQHSVRPWAATLLRWAGVTLAIEGLENIPNRAAVFVANHQGNFDIPVLLAGLDRVYPLVAKVELTRLPLVRGWMKLMGCVFIDRGNMRASMGALREVEARLRGGDSVIIFPEGTRSRGSDMGEFKAGAFRAAAKAGVPIVPVALEGSYRVMEANGNRICPATISLRALPPVETTGVSREEMRAMPAHVQALIAAAKAKPLCS